MKNARPTEVKTSAQNSADSNPKRKFVEIAKIRVDGNTQPRCEIDESVVSDYAEAMRGGTKFPPIFVFDDGSSLWLADGFHRFHAHRHANSYPTIKADVLPGTRRDALLYAFSANTQHGLRENRADKRRKVELMLRDDEWVRWSDREIGRQCGVDHKTVSAARAELVASGEIPHHEGRIGGDGVVQPAAKAAAGPIRGGESPHHDADRDQTAMPEPAPLPPVEVEPAHLPVAAPIAAPAPVAAATARVSEQPTPTTAKFAPGDGEVERLRAENAELRERVERLDECLADYERVVAENATMSAVLAADDKVEAALAESRKYREQVRVLSERINGLINENGAAIRQANGWKRKAEAAEKRAKAAEEASSW